MSVMIIFYLLVFIFGTIVGSFLNVLVLRYGTGISPMKGRSFCFSCGKKLGTLELFPVFSFLFQGGKCKGCQSKISWQYPVVEAIAGLLFVAVIVRYSGLVGILFDSWVVVISLAVIAILVSITVYDIKHKIIPDGLTITFGLLALTKIGLDYSQLALTPGAAKVHVISYLLAGPVLALPFFFLWLFSKGKWMGLGDPKLMVCIGWFLGPIMGLSAIILAFWSGALYGLVLLALSKFRWPSLKITGKTEVPFAPFLVLGFLLVFFFQIDILNLGFLLP